MPKPSHEKPMKPMRAVSYSRVSTEDQAEKGVSLEAQREKIEGYAKLYDLELVSAYQDAGASGKTLDRPGLRAALAALASGVAEALVVLKLDRLTRSVADLGHLLDRYFDKGCLVLHSVTEQVDTRTAGGRLVLNVLMSVAEWERAAISERTSLALRHKRARGERTGAVPLGFRVGPDGVRLEPDPNEQEAIARAQALSEEGLTSAEIARRMDAEGYAGRSGRPFISTQISRMLSR